VANEYAGILNERASVNRARYLATLRRAAAPTCSCRNEAILNGTEVLTEANLEAVTAYCDALRAVGNGDSVADEPTIAVGTYRVEKEHALNLSVVAMCFNILKARQPRQESHTLFRGHLR
jgi:hypothetical protein